MLSADPIGDENPAIRSNPVNFWLRKLPLPRVTFVGTVGEEAWARPAGSGECPGGQETHLAPRGPSEA